MTTANLLTSEKGHEVIINNIVNNFCVNLLVLDH